MDIASWTPHTGAFIARCVGVARGGKPPTMPALPPGLRFDPLVVTSMSGDDGGGFEARVVAGVHCDGTTQYNVPECFNGAWDLVAGLICARGARVAVEGSGSGAGAGAGAGTGVQLQLQLRPRARETSWTVELEKEDPAVMGSTCLW